MKTTALTNIGTIATGDAEHPLAQADTVILAEGKIQKIGDRSLLNEFAVDETYDVGGMTVTPGLIDSHFHPVLGDYAPRQKTIDYIDSCLHGGVTAMISAGEAHTPGRPTTPAGVKALAILAHLSYAKARPSGVKVHGGAVILEPGLTEKDFAEMAEAGVWLVGEVGLGGVKNPAEAAALVEIAHRCGMVVTMHTGGTSIPGSSTVTAEDVLTVKPDVVAHLNGGPTAVSMTEVEKLINGTGFTLEIVQCGNPKVACAALQMINERKDYKRIIMGNDAPSGTGVIPLGILRNICLAASLADVPPEIAVAMATGNTARVFRLSTGMVKEGLAADLVVLDAPLGSVGEDALAAFAAGDIPGVALVLIDGEVRVRKSRNTPPAKRQVKMV